MKRLFVTVFVVFALAFSTKANGQFGPDLRIVNMADKAPYTNNEVFRFHTGWNGDVDEDALPKWKDRDHKAPVQSLEFEVCVTGSYNGYPKSHVPLQEYYDHIWDYFYALLNDVDVSQSTGKFEILLMYPVSDGSTITESTVGHRFHCKANILDINKGFYVD